MTRVARTGSAVSGRTARAAAPTRLPSPMAPSSHAPSAGRPVTDAASTTAKTASIPPTAAVTTVVTVTRRSGRTVSSTARRPPDARADDRDAEHVGPPHPPAAIDARDTECVGPPSPPGTGAGSPTRTGGSHRVPSAATTVAPARVRRLDAGEVSVASPATAAGPATPDTP